ncbi:endonuclease III [Pigmentibacter sp. JX0631]|uniref:endonuclease III n=1 Tax=Pigmentibacter sp. JX0631 TaxID=2976982 RepID=UPI0024696FFF|nr:endonuclease III [Pigmentibacter sp. JX0631]WGL58555.1 endonuclease III [Pigmentibacter sp. JX0631]
MKKSAKIIYDKKIIYNIFSTLQQNWPDAKCELNHNNAFQLLIAVVLSAQATDKSVNKALEPLFTSQPQFSAYDLLEMGEENFLKIIKSIGLAKTKAKNCYNLSGIIVSKYLGKIPESREELETLPGVGRKTANVVMNVVYQQPTMAVDTHVDRVSQRIGLVEQTNDRLKIEEELLKIVPKKFALQAHHLLIFQGRYHCTAKNPKCNTCPIENLCLKNIKH